MSSPLNIDFHLLGFPYDQADRQKIVGKAFPDTFLTFPDRFFIGKSIISCSALI